ncbi:ABC transporter ATP-binding protein [Opitutaceae bacterium EW11]|nr:ABC transporter ATP-binding protein [Opitutaceae bacterium EW11]
MSAAAITVEGLGKRYTLRHRAGGPGLLRDRLANLLRAPFRRRDPGSREEFWALRDLSFEVKQGEVVGIIGRNGAGKSTLLKILSRITEPTTGRAIIQGRVASLLEVGTGFHGELTGRENIFLNGAILGMTRREIRAKFDEIVAFSEVEKFLDTPVKFYSSGMYVRLAFAVAAHLEPEILIVDEVLAVGDAAFQKKCLGKMREVATGQGRTVLFVSHNSSALLDLCERGIWLQQGRRAGDGPIRETLSTYLQTGSAMQREFAVASDRPGIASVELDSAALQAGNLRFRVTFRSPTPLRPPVVGLIVYNKLGQPVCGANTRMTGPEWQPAPASAGTIAAAIESPPLQSDSYRVSVWLGDAGQDYDHQADALSFDYVAPHFHPKSPPPEVIGPLNLPWKWSWEDRA